MSLSVGIVGTQAETTFGYLFFCNVSYFKTRKPELSLKETEWEE